MTFQIKLSVENEILTVEGYDTEPPKNYTWGFFDLKKNPSIMEILFSLELAINQLYIHHDKNNRNIDDKIIYRSVAGFLSILQDKLITNLEGLNEIRDSIEIELKELDIRR